MGDKAEVTSFGNCSSTSLPKTALSSSSSSSSAIARRRSAVVDRLRRRIELFRGRSSANSLPVLTLKRRRANVAEEFIGGSDLQFSVPRFGEEIDHEGHRCDRSFTGMMMTDGGCWTPMPPPESAAMMETGVGGRWAMRDGGPRISAAVPAGIDVRQWQSAEVQSSSAASSRMLHNALIGHHLSPTVPCVAPHQPPTQHHHHHHQQQQQYQGCSMAQAPPRYDGTGGQGVGSGGGGGSAVASPRVDDATATASAGGGATVSVSIVHNLDATGLYNQAKGEIKLTFSSTLSAPVAPQTTDQDQSRHDTTCPVQSSSASDQSSAVAAVVAATTESTHRRSACWTMPNSTTTTAVTRMASATTNSGHQMSHSSTTATSATTTNTEDQHTNSDADDIISEFLGQINGNFASSSGDPTNGLTEHQLYSQSNMGQQHRGRLAAPQSSDATLRHVVVTSNSARDSRVFTSPMGQSVTHPSESVYGLPTYQQRRKEPEMIGGSQRQIGVQFKPNSSYVGYAALPEYNLPTGAMATGGSGRDIATGPAAETLKKMAAMHRSLYEKAPSPSSGDIWYPASAVDPYNNFQSTAFDYRNAAEQFTEYNKTPLYRQHQYLPPAHNTGSTMSGTNIDPATYGYSQPLSLQPNPTSNIRALPPYNNAAFGGAMKPLSHFPDVGGGEVTRLKTSAGGRNANAVSMGSSSSRPKGQTLHQSSSDQFIRLSQSQHVTVQQHHVGGSDALHNGNGSRIDASQTQHVHVRVAVGQSATMTGQQQQQQQHQQQYGGAVPSETRRPPDASYCRPSNTSSSWRPDMGQPVQTPYDRCMPQVPPSSSGGPMACPTDVRWLRQTPSYAAAAAVNTSAETRGNYDGVDRIGIDGYRQPTTGPLQPPVYRRESDQTSVAPIASHHQDHLGSNNGVYQFQPGAAGQYVFHADQKQSVSFGVGGSTQRIQQQQSMSSEYCGVPSSQCSMPPHPAAGQYQQHYRHQQQHQHQQLQQKQEEELHSWNSLPAPTQSSKDRTTLGGSTVGCSTESSICVSGDVVQSYTVADFDDVVEMATVDGTNFMPDGCFSRAAAVSGASAVENANDLSFIDEIFGDR